MRFVDEFRDADKAHALAAKIAALCEPGRQYKLMEVCGGHTHTIYKHGLEDYLPESITLVHGPGCPVCVIPMGRVDDAIHLASQPDVIMTSFGDMMRVPGSGGSFFDANAEGTNIRMVYSPLDSLKIARQNPDKQVVFMAIGFETTAPSTAMTMLRAAAEGLENFSVFCNHVTIVPAIKAILDSPDLRLDGFIGPGHVSTVIGCRPYEFIARDYGKPVVVAGFEPLDILQSIYMLMLQLSQGRSEVENQYSRVVPWDGNLVALKAIGETMELRPYFEWRGLGFISHSALQVREKYAAMDAERLFQVPGVRVADPKACQCGEVLKGVLKPWECKVFGTACTPETPIGTCMVSPEGACAAYYNFGRMNRTRVAEASAVMTVDHDHQPGWIGEALAEHDELEAEGRHAAAAGRPGAAGAGPDRPGPAAPAQGPRRAHHDVARRGRQGDAHPDRGGLPRRVPQPAARAAGGRGPAAACGDARVALTTDSYVVSPLFFPGGNIGDLAVNGTVNDLAVSGATPLYLSAGFILEEGFPVADLNRVVESMRDAAVAAGVHIVTGDTKVVQKGKADGCYINTAGVGLIERDVSLGVAQAQPGDAIIVSGPIGDHGITIMLARGELDIEADICSDTAPLNGLVAGLLDAVPGVRAMRDATRGGVATILNEIARAADVGVLVSEDEIPVRAEVRGASELLGIDPMYVACEGRLVAVVPGDQADQAVAALRAHPLGEQAAVIGRVRAEQPGIVQLKTAFGGTRIVDLLVGDPLPRIC